MRFSRAEKVKIVGVGDAGNKIINRLIDEKLSSRFDMIAMNTNKQALMQSKAKTRVLLGINLLHGNGAGGDPHLGQLAAEESFDELYEILHLADAVYLVAGMGGGTGSGALPVIARIAQERRARTIAIVCVSYSFEGAKRQQTTEVSLRLLGEHVDELVKIRLDNLLKIMENNPTLNEGFMMADGLIAWEVIRRLLP